MLGTAPHLREDKLQLEGVRNPSCYLVLDRKQVANVAIEPLGPQVRISFGVYQLSVDANLAARPTDAAFQHVAYAQLAADLLGVDRLIPISECGIARNH